MESRLKEIFLNALDRIINPNFNNWFVRSIFILGAGLVGLGNIGTVFSEIVIEIDWIVIALKIGNDNGLFLTFIGMLLVLMSICIHIKTKFNTDGLQITTTNLVKDCYRDIRNDNYTIYQKKKIISNKIREINDLLSVEIKQNNSFNSASSNSQLIEAWGNIELEINKKIGPNK